MNGSCDWTKVLKGQRKLRIGDKVKIVEDANTFDAGEIGTLVRHIPTKSAGYVVKVDWDGEEIYCTREEIYKI
jgi:hypothetical protein